MLSAIMLLALWAFSSASAMEATSGGARPKLAMELQQLTADNINGWIGWDGRYTERICRDFLRRPAVLAELPRSSSGLSPEESEAIICGGKVRIYTRFTEETLEGNEKRWALGENALKEMSPMSVRRDPLAKEFGDLRRKKAYLAAALRLLAIPLAEDGPGILTKRCVKSQRTLLTSLHLRTSDAIKLICKNNDLARLALDMIKAHLFHNLNPFALTQGTIHGDDEEDNGLPQWKESGMETLTPIYELLQKLTGVANPKAAIHHVIESDPNFVANLYALLDLPDAAERKHVALAIVRLFSGHPALRMPILAMVKNSFQVAIDGLLDEDYQVLLNGPLSIFRHCAVGHFEQPIEAQDQAIIEEIRQIFMVQHLGLLRLTGLVHFGDQWTITFATLQACFPSEEVWPALWSSMFLPTGHQNYGRDALLILVYLDLYREGCVSTDLLVPYLRFLMEEAERHRIRPLLIEEMLDEFFGPESLIYAEYNSKDGKRITSIIPTCKVNLVINIGTCQLYLAFKKLGIAIPKYLEAILELWVLSDDLIAYVGSHIEHFDDLLAQYVEVKELYAWAVAGSK